MADEARTRAPSHRAIAKGDHADRPLRPALSCQSRIGSANQSTPSNDVRGSEVSEPNWFGEPIDAFVVAIDGAAAERGSELSEPDWFGEPIDGSHLDIDGIAPGARLCGVRPAFPGGAIDGDERGARL